MCFSKLFKKKEHKCSCKCKQPEVKVIDINLTDEVEEDITGEDIKKLINILEEISSKNLIQHAGESLSVLMERWKSMEIEEYITKEMPKITGSILNVNLKFNVDKAGEEDLKNALWQAETLKEVICDALDYKAERISKALKDK